MKRTLLQAVFLLICFTSVTQAQNTAPKETIAVYYFTTARDYSYDYAEGVGNAIEAGILRANRFKVVERNRFGAIKDEDKFREANTSEIVNKAGKLGAKTIVTGHVVGVSRGDLMRDHLPTGREYIEISVSFKIIDVATGEIKKSEIIRGRGEGQNYSQAAQQAYITLDGLARGNVAAYLPQRFKFMSVVTTGNKKGADYLEQFKIWAGSDDGLRREDVVEIYRISNLTNPNTGQKVEEKEFLAQAAVTEVNGGSTATCAVIDAKKRGAAVLAVINSHPADLVLEYKGNWYIPQPTWRDVLLK